VVKKYKIKVVILDDETYIAKYMKYLLLSNNIASECFYCTQDAYNYIKHNNSIKLLLTDVALNENKTGIDFGEKIYKEFNVPYVIMSAIPQDSFVFRSSEELNGLRGYIGKPFIEDNIVCKIKNTLEGYRAEKLIRINNHINEVFHKK